MEKHPNIKRPDKELLELLEITLKNNDFIFNNEQYLQVCGASMGRTYVPGIADLYLEYLDDRAMFGFKLILFFIFAFWMIYFLFGSGHWKNCENMKIT